MADVAGNPNPSGDTNPTPENAEDSSKPKSSSSSDTEDLLHKVRNLMRRITAARPSPHPRFLHTLAAILEEEESRFEKTAGHLTSMSSRSSHNIGRLVNLMRENDDFVELLSSKLLVESRYSTAVQAAAARLLLASLCCGMYPDVFDDAVLSNLKKWVTEEIKPASDPLSPKKLPKNSTATDWEMLKTYSLGLMSVALSGGAANIVEDVLATGVAAKLMHFLRMRVLKESGNPKESTGVSSAAKNKDDSKSRTRLAMEISRNDAAEDAGEATMTAAENSCMYDADDDGDWTRDEKCGKKDKKEWQNKPAILNIARQVATEDATDEALRGEPSKRKGDARDRGSCKVKGKGKIPGGVNDFSSRGIRIGSGPHQDKARSMKENSSSNKLETEVASMFEDADSKKDPDDMFRCIIADDFDISVPVRKAAKAAETEARTAGASDEAVKAAGEAAADLVKAAALEALGPSLDKEAALKAAISAAASVEDAAAATKAITTQLVKEEEEEVDLEFPELGDCVPTSEALANLREQLSVQCLERLGEYLEVLGPVLHERGVDVCLALLQRESATEKNMKPNAMLPDVLKLICALAAHRKFSAMFVDRGGVQLILAAPRTPQTYTGISLCLFAFASVQGVMERVCAAPAEVVNEVVNLALHILESGPDAARRNAALFFGASFVFRAILEAFDAQEGLRQMLNLLRNASVVRSGGDPSMPGSSSTSRSDRSASADVLTSSEKQIAHHTCVALRQYFRAQLLILVDSIRPYKGRSGSRMLTNGRAGYKPLDISNEAIDNLLLQIQRDRKLGPAFVRARWTILETFMSYSGHIVLLELTQVAPGERYLHDIAPYALGILQIVTLMPSARRPIVNSTLSNDRSGMAVILDAASATGFAEPEGIQAALLVLVNLVCPPPSLSSRPNQPQNVSHTPQQQAASSAGEAKDKQRTESFIDKVTGSSTAEARERSGKGEGTSEKSGNGLLSSSNSQTLGCPSPAATLVGDRRISLGSVAGGSGIAAYMEQGYRQARDAVRANNGIKVLLHLLHPRTVLSPTSLDCIRALACRVLLGLARDDAIAHILTKLQVGKVLSELLRDGTGPMGRVASTTGGGEQGRWHAELGQLSMELMAIVTNAGRASTLAASDAAAPTLRRIERAAIAAATSISYPSKELLQLIHEHLVLSGLSNTASTLLKEAQIAPLPSLPSQVPSYKHSNTLEPQQEVINWPSGKVSGGFLVEASKTVGKEDDVPASARKKGPTFSSSFISAVPSSVSKTSTSKESREQCGGRTDNAQEFKISGSRLGDSDYTDASRLPAKRKFSDRAGLQMPNKRLATNDREISSLAFMSPPCIRNLQAHENCLPPSPLGQGHREKLESLPHLGTPIPSQSLTSLNANLAPEAHTCQPERATLDSLVVQYLKHQHRQCPAPITTLPPISLFHPHVCPEPSRACYAPYNIAGRLSSRAMIPPYGGMHGRRRDRHFIYSRFRPLRPCRDERILLTSTTFLGTTFRLAAGSLAGEIRLFDCHSGDVLETHICHQSPITLLQSSPVEVGDSAEFSGTHPGHLLLSSGSFDVRLWNSSSLGEVPLYNFDGCRSARFNNCGSKFAAISSVSHKEVLLYDVQTGTLGQKLSDNTSSVGILRGSAQCIPHFSPSDTLLLWNGVLWDHRAPRAVHRFDQFTDYGGGGFHPAGNEVIINSEVWDLRSYKLLRSVPSLDQTVITFNATGDVIYATLRRNLEDITAALHPRRGRHPLFSAFRTMDAVDYTDIATTPVDRCVLDLATEPTDSLISVVALDGHDEMDSFAKLYEVGRRKPTDDDSDPDDGVETDDDEDSLADEDDLEDVSLHGEGDDSDPDGSNDNDDPSGDEELEDADMDFDTNDDDDVIEVDGSIVELISDGSEDDTRLSYSSDDDGSLGDYDDDFNDILQGFL